MHTNRTLNKHNQREQARELRRNTTPPEQVLWSHLRDRQLAGVKFRRQHPLGPYTLDFFATEINLAIELDSRYHDEQREAQRDAHLASLGITTLRITASQLAQNLTAVLEAIRSKAENLHSQPRPRSGRGRRRPDAG